MKINNILMVDLKSQYKKIKGEIDYSIINTIESSQYIGGPQVETFKLSLENYLDVKHVIPCANGTDALQIALMALELKPGDEVIVPAFTYVATAEVIGLLGLKPIMVDVDLDSFNISLKNLQKVISSKTKAIVPVHLLDNLLLWKK
jgi:dTDP-4-amino-4,6-dideoxygalactose transaminase